jgi:electron transfer flavoprotein beta subunit
MAFIWRCLISKLNLMNFRGVHKMKIVVCVKQVPGVSSVKIDSETKRLIREGVVSVINPFDYYALEEALRIKKIYGGTITALSMGPQKAEQALREALAFGVDEAILLCDKRFAGSDTWVTSYVLSLAIKKLAPVDLVFCGKQAIDGDTAQVGPGIAAHLQTWPHAAGVAAVNGFEKGRLSVKRMTDFGYDECLLKTPAVLSVTKEINEPGVPKLKGWLQAEKVSVAIWDAEKIGADEKLLGLNGSPTRVVKTAMPQSRNKNTKLFNGGDSDNAKKLFHELRMISAI